MQKQCNMCGTFVDPTPCSFCPSLFCTRCKMHHEPVCEKTQKMKRVGLGPTVRQEGIANPQPPMPAVPDVVVEQEEGRVIPALVKLMTPYEDFVPLPVPQEVTDEERAALTAETESECGGLSEGRVTTMPAILGAAYIPTGSGEATAQPMPELAEAADLLHALAENPTVVEQLAAEGLKIDEEALNAVQSAVQETPDLRSTGATDSEVPAVPGPVPTDPDGPVQGDAGTK